MAYAPIAPYLAYEDADAAIEWLTRVFGFTETLRSTGDDGKVNHAELELEGGWIMLGAPGGDYQGPKQTGGARHIFVHAYVKTSTRTTNVRKRPAQTCSPSPRTRSTATAATRSRTSTAISGSSHSTFATSIPRSGARKRPR